MNILCIFPAAPNSLWDYTQKIGGLPPLPGYITKRNTQVNKQGAVDQMVILYEFDKSKFAEAMGYICRQLSSLRDDVSEISVSAHAYSPHQKTKSFTLGFDSVERSLARPVLRTLGGSQ